MVWRTDFPPTDRPFLLAWKFSSDDLFPHYAICKLSQVDTYGGEDAPIPVYLPADETSGEELEFDDATWFAWAELDVPTLGPWAAHIVDEDAV